MPSVRRLLNEARVMNPWNDWLLAQLVAFQFVWMSLVIIVLKA